MKRYASHLQKEEPSTFKSREVGTGESLPGPVLTRGRDRVNQELQH